MKTVILVWTQNCCNLKRNGYENYWGLGDIIRGTIKLYQLSKKYNFELIVNINLHPISLFLKKRLSIHDELILNNKNNINFIGNVENHINNSNDNIIYFFTNDFCDQNNIDNECKNFIKNILTPNDEMDKTLNDNNLKFYDIIHLRLGDLNMNNDYFSNNFTENIKKIISTNANKNKKNIVVCDSTKFKNLLKRQNFFEDKNLQIYDLEVGHIGYEENVNKIKNTMFEFFVVSKSELIKTYTIYSWNSGFVYWISKIYDIPLVKINKRLFYR